MPILDPFEMNNTIFQPILAFQFRFLIDGIPTYMIKSVNGLGFTEGEDFIYYINKYYQLATRRKYKDITLSLYDPCSPSGGQAVEEWAKLRFERVTGRASYFDVYAKDVVMHVTGPSGDIVREWIIKQAFVKDVDYGDYNYETETHTSITLTLGHSGLDLSY
jgi:hypothetical protein